MYTDEIERVLYMAKQITEQEQLKLKQLDGLEPLTEFEQLGWFTYGSQALGIQDEQSDVDVLTLVMPSHRDMFYGEGKNKKITDVDNEQIIVWRINQIIRTMVRMELQFVEALHRPLRVKDDFKGLYDSILLTMQTPEAQTAFNITLYYTTLSYTRPKELNAKNIAKAYLYSELYKTDDPLKYYRDNQVPQEIKTKYHYYKGLDVVKHKDELEQVKQDVQNYMDGLERPNKKGSLLSDTKEFKQFEQDLLTYVYRKLVNTLDSKV